MRMILPVTAVLVGRASAKQAARPGHVAAESVPRLVAETEVPADQTRSSCYL